MSDELQRRIKVFCQVGTSAVVLIAALYIILSGAYPEDYNKWAFGIVGVVVGYWLR
jgi:hypothetical protein